MRSILTSHNSTQMPRSISKNSVTWQSEKPALIQAIRQAFKNGGYGVPPSYAKMRQVIVRVVSPSLPDCNDYFLRQNSLRTLMDPSYVSLRAPSSKSLTVLHVFCQKNRVQGAEALFGRLRNTYGQKRQSATARLKMGDQNTISPVDGDASSASKNSSDQKDCRGESSTNKARSDLFVSRVSDSISHELTVMKEKMAVNARGTRSVESNNAVLKRAPKDDARCSRSKSSGAMVAQASLSRDGMKFVIKDWAMSMNDGAETFQHANRLCTVKSQFAVPMDDCSENGNELQQTLSFRDEWKVDPRWAKMHSLVVAAVHESNRQVNRI